MILMRPTKEEAWITIMASLGSTLPTIVHILQGATSQNLFQNKTSEMRSDPYLDYTSWSFPPRYLAKGSGKRWRRLCLSCPLAIQKENLHVVLVQFSQLR